VRRNPSPPPDSFNDSDLRGGTNGEPNDVDELLAVFWVVGLFVLSETSWMITISPPKKKTCVLYMTEPNP